MYKLQINEKIEKTILCLLIILFKTADVLHVYHGVVLVAAKRLAQAISSLNVFERGENLLQNSILNFVFR